MGVYDRDYYRDDAPAPGWLAGSAKICKRLIAINVVVYLLQLATANHSLPDLARLALENSPSPHGALPRFFSDGVSRWLELSLPDVLSGQVWRLVTYGFCHAVHGDSAILHIVFNMLGLWWFGVAIEEMYGSREFLKFYLTALVVSGVSHCALQLMLPAGPPAVGASGAVLAVMMVYATYYPRQRMLLMFIIPIEIRWLMAIVVVLDLYPVLQALQGSAPPDGIAHAAHVGGLLYGFLYRHFDLRFSRLFADWRWSDLTRKFRRGFARQPQFKVYQPEEPSPHLELTGTEFREKVDEILAKISEHGEASLSPAERDLLREASRRFKQRQQ